MRFQPQFNVFLRERACCWEKRWPPLLPDTCLSTELAFLYHSWLELRLLCLTCGNTGAFLMVALPANLTTPKTFCSTLNRSELNIPSTSICANMLWPHDLTQLALLQHAPSLWLCTEMVFLMWSYRQLTLRWRFWSYSGGPPPCSTDSYLSDKAERLSEELHGAKLSPPGPSECESSSPSADSRYKAESWKLDKTNR